MTDQDIQGTVTDSNGDPVSGAIVELTKSYQTNPQNEQVVLRTTTDSNGNYVFNYHPDSDETSQEWHVSAYSHDGSSYLNSFNNPGVTADLPSTAIPDSGISHWNFEESLNDVWENSTVFNGNAVGGVQYSTDSRVNEYSLKLNGTDAYVSLGTDIGLNPDGPFSIAGWVKMNETPDRATLLSCFSSGSNGTSFDVEISSYKGDSGNDGAFGVHTWSGYVSTDPDVVAPVGTWEHYCVTFSGGLLNDNNITLYVGGSQVAATRVDSNGNNLSNNVDDFEIGFSSKNTSNINLQDMNVDSVKTFSKELSSAEVSNLANNKRI